MIPDGLDRLTRAPGDHIDLHLGGFHIESAKIIA